MRGSPQNEPETWWSQTPAGYRLRIRLQPGAKRTEVQGVADGELRIRLAARPVDGAANKALTALLGKLLGVPRSAVTISRGVRSRHKVVDVADPQHRHSPEQFLL